MTQLDNTCEGTNGAAIGASNIGAPNAFDTASASGTGTTNTFTNSQAHGGSTSIDFHLPSGVSASSFTSWKASIPGTPLANGFLRTYIYLTAIPAFSVGTVAGVLRFLTSTPAVCAQLVIVGSTSQFRILNSGGGTVATMTATIPLNQWVRVEFDLTSISGSTGNVAARMFSGSNLETNTPDSGGSISGSGVSVTGTFSEARIGPASAITLSSAWDELVDDVAFNDTATPGPSTTDPLTLAWGAGGNYWHLYNDDALRDRREVPAQRAYVSIPGAVDTPANPLPSPLDTAWQADAAYWHLYNDSALRDRREYFTQRPLVSDPNLLQPAGNADPLALNPEQSDSSDLWRVAAVPAFYDRREVPQQRQYYDLSLLATALLENELLGGGDTARHAWWQRPPAWPQQRPSISDPSFYPVQQQIGAGTTEAWWGVSTDDFYGQRAYISDPSFYPQPNALDPLLAGQGLLDGHQHQAATHADRREVPQQRPYISDPSFYPTVAPTDPLTLAWGAGGNYWHLYNRAADITDRREVPQQRAYVSDPLLLTTALLESPFLGGGDTGRHYTWFTDRREVPAQRVYLAAVDLPLDPVLAAFADLARRYGLPFTHADRREVPQQRTYFPVPPPPPAVVNATSSPAVSAPDASGAAVTGSGSTSLVTAAAASAPGVSDG